MVACSLITLASIPIYSALYHAFSSVGLAIASDIGIAANTVALAALLHRRKLLPAGQLPWKELGKAGITAVVAGLLSQQVARAVPIRNSRTADFQALGLITITWIAAVAAGLWITQSDLPRALRRRKTVTTPMVAETGTQELRASLEP
jgi:putative peptidoglycan lipid II flippase